MSIKTNKEVEVKSSWDNSWVLAYADGSEFYIPNALHVEKNDEKMLVKDDKQACIEAEKVGIPFIYDMYFVPNKVYVDTDENREILSKMLELHPEYKKIGLLYEIFEFYGYTYEVCEDGSVKEFEDGAVKEFNENGGFTLYSSISEALKEWVYTMEETNKNIFETGDVEDEFNTWTKNEIEFIKNI